MRMVNGRWQRSMATVDYRWRQLMATVDCQWRRSLVTVTTTVDGNGSGWWWQWLVTSDGWQWWPLARAMRQWWRQVEKQQHQAARIAEPWRCNHDTKAAHIRLMMSVTSSWCYSSGIGRAVAALQSGDGNRKEATVAAALQLLLPAQLGMVSEEPRMWKNNQPAVTGVNKPAQAMVTAAMLQWWQHCSSSCRTASNGCIRIKQCKKTTTNQRWQSKQANTSKMVQWWQRHHHGTMAASLQQLMPSNRWWCLKIFWK